MIEVLPLLVVIVGTMLAIAIIWYEAFIK